MKIVFLPSSSIPFHGKTLDERPLGGIETAIIRLAEALQELGAKPIVLTNIENPPLTKPLYVPMRAIGDLGPVDALIVVREWKPLFLPIEARKRFLWTGDSYDQFQSMGFADKRIIERVDALLLVSEWHRRTFCEQSGFPLDKARVLKNGIDPTLFQGSERRQPKRLIYSSTPYRGLKHMLDIFPKIKAAHPDAEFHIFSGFNVYRGAGSSDAHLDSAEREFNALSEQLQRMPGCVVHGNVTQDVLAREFMRSSILAYPNTFEETSCITAMEAQAGGCAVVTSRRGALPETIENAGFLVDGEPGTSAYNASFISTVNELLSDQQKLKLFSETALSQAREFTWTKRAHSLLQQIINRTSP